MSLAPHLTAPTRDTRRVDMLAGCAPIAVELGHARITVREALHRHRNAQRVRFGFGAPTSFTRSRVLAAIGRVREIEARIEATLGHLVPVRSDALKMAAE